MLRSEQFCEPQRLREWTEHGGFEAIVNCMQRCIDHVRHGIEWRALPVEQTHCPLPNFNLRMGVTTMSKSMKFRHAPGHLREQFVDVVFAYTHKQPLPVVEYNEEPISAKRLCGLLWNSGDQVLGGLPDA